ncbi:astacin-like metalloprotease toxin 2 [Octopus vulgaris]|uniref:Metalloendopeptidase n=1 Tax=Octopus vulgaris TaxID=6645 RepID=A0AA36AFS6_OCTVU|nr:astacin-like metalloprotease toxin 2 [Octopus vulgaris]
MHTTSTFMDTPQKKDLDSQYPEVVTGTYDVDIHKQDSNRFKRNVVPNSSGQWPQTKIPYKITQDFSELDKKKFLTAMKTIEDLTRYNGKDYRRPNFRKIDSSSFNTLNLPYDYDSIMHYPHNAFAIDGRYSTIITKVKGVRIGQRIGMSQLDIKKVQRLYGCLERELVPPQNGNISSPNCTFDKDLCGWNHREINSPMNANKWVRHSFFETSPNTGPTYDHTYRTFQGFYLYLKAVPNQDSVARIQTPQLPPGNYCLTFWYQIRGLSRIEFEGRIGNSSSTDIAVDDVIFLPRLCSTNLHTSST